MPIETCASIQNREGPGSSRSNEEMCHQEGDAWENPAGFREIRNMGLRSKLGAAFLASLVVEGQWTLGNLLKGLRYIIVLLCAKECVLNLLPSVPGQTELQNSTPTETDSQKTLASF